MEKQEQHQIQKAYLKEFSNNNLLWVYNKDSGLQRRPETTNSRTTERNFQSLEKEQYQNDGVERPGIKSLRKLLSDDKWLDETDVMAILSWVSLHSLRNSKKRKKLFPTREAHENNFNTVLDIEHSYIDKINTFDIFTCSGDDYFITSDNPVQEVEILGKYYFILPLSPKKAVVLTAHGGEFPNHEELSFPEIANSMQLGGCAQECYSHRKDLPFDTLKSNGAKFNLVPKLETIQFRR